jgi:hypothetical protein
LQRLAIPVASDGGEDVKALLGQRKGDGPSHPAGGASDDHVSNTADQ